MTLEEAYNNLERYNIVVLDGSSKEIDNIISNKPFLTQETFDFLESLMYEDVGITVTNSILKIIIGGTFMLKEYLKKFCELNEEIYTYYEGYSGRGMFGEKCPAFVVKQGSNFMQAIMEFTRYLEEQGFDDVNLECEGVSYDNLGLDMIVYFPSARN